MVRTYKKKQNINNVCVLRAITEIENGETYKNVSRKYKLSAGYLNKIIKRKERNEDLFPKDKRGMKTALPADVEDKLASVLRTMEPKGFAPTLDEFAMFVHDYVTEYNIETPFKNNMPGIYWRDNFLRRHKLKLKKGIPMDLARKKVISDSSPSPSTSRHQEEIDMDDTTLALAIEYIKKVPSKIILNELQRRAAPNGSSLSITFTPIKDSDTDDEEEEEWIIEKGKNFKDKKVKVPSLRVDAIVKAGFGLSRNKAEENFYKGKIKINDSKPKKKSEMVQEGDILDITIKDEGESSEILRLKVLKIGEYEESRDRFPVLIRKYTKLDPKDIDNEDS